jgi:signal transduction histidine kinase
MSIDRLREHPVLRYVLAVVAVGATIAVLIPLRFLIEPLPSPPFLLIIMVVAWLVGLGPAIVTVLISAVALDYWFIPPLGAVISTWHEAASVVSFIAIGSSVAWLTATRRQVEDDRQALLVRERASRASAEAANRAKDEFVAMLGHEFRNPLSAIINAVQILERVGAPDDTTRHAREVVARQAKNITRMVEDLLEINRIATGKIRLDLQPIELADMVRHCLATLAGRTAAHRVSLDAAEVWVDADPVRLEQIVVNLLDNAVKYTPAGGAIHVRVSREGAHAALRVRDTGVGIAPDVLPRIFDLFVQGESGTIQGRGGLGIGLAVVQRLADLHGGTIEADSDGPGRGSTFCLRLRSVAPPVRTPRGRPALALTRAARRRILVAESDPDLRAVLRALLETSGHDVGDTANGPEAFATALRTRPDIMLIDVELPGFDGYELARRLRMAPETKATRLVALIGWERVDDVDRARAAGFDQHASKPLDGDALAEILGR